MEEGVEIDGERRGREYGVSGSGMGKNRRNGLMVMRMNENSMPYFK